MKVFIQRYYDFFDNQLGDTTLVVALISIMICLVGFLGNQKNGHLWSGNILQSKSIVYNTHLSENIIEIDGKKYKIILENIE